MLTYLWIIDLYIFVFSEMTKKKKVHDKGDSDPPPAATRKERKKRKKTKTRIVKFVHIAWRPVRLKNQHQAGPGVKGMCSLNFRLSLFLIHCCFSLPSCIYVIRLQITNILILFFHPFSSDRESAMDSSAEERSARNASSGVSQMTRKKRGRPLKDTTQ